MSLAQGWAIAILILLAGAHVRNWCDSPTFKLIAGMSTLAAWWMAIFWLAPPTAVFIAGL